jgi:hypothetical protein
MAPTVRSLTTRGFQIGATASSMRLSSATTRRPHTPARSACGSERSASTNSCMAGGFSGTRISSRSAMLIVSAWSSYFRRERRRPRYKLMAARPVSSQRMPAYEYATEPGRNMVPRRRMPIHAEASSPNNDATLGTPRELVHPSRPSRFRTRTSAVSHRYPSPTAHTPEIIAPGRQRADPDGHLPIRASGGPSCRGSTSSWPDGHSSLAQRGKGSVRRDAEPLAQLPRGPARLVEASRLSDDLVIEALTADRHTVLSQVG